MGDIRQFNLQLDRFAKKVNVAAETLQKRVALDLYGRIIRKTPVDTGRARASWTINPNTADRTVPPPGLPSYPEPKASVLSVTPGGEIWISNNLPYIGELENGHSQQAPAGMVALSIAEVEQQLTALERASVKEAGL